MADKYIYNNSGNLAEKSGLVESVGADDGGKIVALDTNGKLNESVMPVGIGADVKSLPASEDMSAGNFVNIWSDEGTIKVRKADASSNKTADGFVREAVTTGNNALVYLEGTNDELTGLTGGSFYFLSNSAAGAVMATAPTTSAHIVQKVGKALSATEISFEPSSPITLA